MKVRLVKLIHEAVLNQIPQEKVMRKVRDIIDSIPNFNIREKAQMYVLVKKTATLMYMQEGKLYNKQILKYSTGINKIQEHADARGRLTGLRDEMRSHRAEGGVFYLLSSHSNPALGHAPYQGQIFVDRFWRVTTGGDKRVQAYIRNHDTMTVQEIIKEPVYMITRPYCKHFFIELNTEEVLNNGLKRVRSNHPEAQVRTHNINYRTKYYKLREKIHTVLEMESEAAWDKKLIKKRQG